MTNQSSSSGLNSDPIMLSSSTVIRSVSRGKSWLTKRNVGIRRVRASRNRAENTVALRVKALVRRSNSIAIAVTKSVREISSKPSHEKAQKAQKHKSGLQRLKLLCFLRLFVAACFLIISDALRLRSPDDRPSPDRVGEVSAVVPVLSSDRQASDN